MHASGAGALCRSVEQRNVLLNVRASRIGDGGKHGERFRPCGRDGYSGSFFPIALYTLSRGGEAAPGTVISSYLCPNFIRRVHVRIRAMCVGDALGQFYR